MVKPIVNLQKRLRDYIVARKHIGHLRPGDRLPSYRELSAKWDVDHRMIARAYRALEAEGLVEIRGRAGVFLRDQGHIGGELPSETARWVAGDVLTEAWQRRLKIPELPSLVRKCTASVKLRTACIESTVDHRELLCRELRDWFGFATEGVSTSHLPAQDADGPVKGVPTADLPEAVRAADVLVTTAFHAHEVRPIAEVLDKPYVVVSMHPVAAEIFLDRLREGPITVVCADPGFGDRVRLLAGAEYQDRIRVVLARDSRAVGELGPDEPVFISTAARALLARHPPSFMKDVPAFSRESAAELAFLLIRLNLERAPASG
ncbi:MAG TPA: GntR family transcriptional regulator [Longimicrobiaceae bacterium]|nr:GntR family transcriptional regulator [Longimicrobiaceae bacterium]